MTTDRFVNTFSETSPTDAAAIDDFVHGFLAYQPKAANILAAADKTPSSALINAYAGMLWMFLEAPVAADKAAPYISRAQNAENANPRERSTINIASTWASGNVPETMRLCEAHSDQYPRDLVIIKLAQYLYFNTGDAPSMLRAGLKALPAASGEPFVHGMIAFGYEQCHQLEQAEASARHAIDIEPTDAWAHHAIAHVMLTQGRVLEGAAFMEEMAPRWDGLNSFMYSHNWWHLALFYISMGKHDEVRAAYDTHVWGLEKNFAQDQIGAASLLARMELAGIDVEDRWKDVADHIALRGADTTLPFLTMQYLYALGRSNDPMADTLISAIKQKASAPSFEQEVWRNVALPACEGLLAYTRGDFETAVRELGHALPRMAEIGGSHAQRDLFEQVHLDALMKTERLAQAQQVLEMRRTFDPDGVPLNRMLAEVYQKTGLPDLAEAALNREPH
jgi:tetratricopeptide (TPR) repeat protein